MADINQVQLPDGSQYNIKDDISGYATETYVQNQISGITKATIGLGNVDNTSDANKPVSTAQQTALDGKTNTSMVAYVESSTTATKRYEIGDKFILNGVLYKATSIIANAGTIEVGTNCTASDPVATQIDTVKGAVNAKANKTDLTSISETGSTASQAISAGTYFYLDGTLVRAKTDIASGATFTLNTNYEVVSAGALNSRGMKLLWENPSPTASFAGQNITLSSDNYDFLLWVYKEQASTSYYLSVMSPKGAGASFGLPDIGASGNSNRVRRATYVDNTHFTFGNGFVGSSSTYTSDNSVMIPIAIYGIKII